TRAVIQNFETARALALASDRSRLIQRRLGRNSLLPGLRFKLQLHTPSVPAHEPRSYDQQDYAHHAHEDLDDHSVGDLDQDDMGGKRQEGTEDEDWQRMLAANHERPQHIRGERWPSAWYVPDGQGRHGEKVSQTQRVEVGLVDGIHGVG